VATPGCPGGPQKRQRASKVLAWQTFGFSNTLVFDRVLQHHTIAQLVDVLTVVGYGKRIITLPEK
jgi:hypothetical protein